MKQINKKVKYILDGDTAKLYAKRKIGSQKWVHFANCHAATAALMKTEGWDKWKHLIKMVEGIK